MQAPLLIYFKEYEVEFWSIDQNKRLIPINCGSDNKAPLYFLVNGDQIAMDQNAKMQFELESDNCYGNYWTNLLNPQLKYNRFNSSHPFSTLLAYSIKENILPAIIRFNYSNLTQESFLNTFQTVIVYDSFIDEQHRNIINKELIEIIGFNPSSLVSFDYWELYRSYYEKNGKLNSKESFISINSALGDLNINLVAQYPTLTINKKTLNGRGNDPRVDTILEYVAELAIRKGSLVSNDEIKKRLINEGPVILGLLKEGWVSYKIKNRNIGIYPLNLDFYRSVIDNRLNNRASLNYIQGELDSFRNNNQANGFKILLNGEIINQDVFINFFKTTYSNVETESIDFSQNFKTFIFNFFDDQPNLNTQEVKIPLPDGRTSDFSQTENRSTVQQESVSSSEVKTNSGPPIIRVPNTSTTKQTPVVRVPAPSVPKPPMPVQTAPPGVSIPKPATPPSKEVPNKVIPPMPPGIRQPPLPPNRAVPPPVSVKSQSLPGTKVKPPPLPPVPTTKVNNPPVPPSLKPPPVPKGVKLPPPPPPPFKKK